MSGWVQKTGKYYTKSKYWFMICLALMYALMIIAYIVLMVFSSCD